MQIGLIRAISDVILSNSSDETWSHLSCLARPSRRNVNTRVVLYSGVLYIEVFGFGN